MNFVDGVSFYRINGLDYAVRDHGARRGRPLILLHGLMDTGASFCALVDALEQRCPGRYRYIAPDWRGHGASAHARGDYWFPQYLADLDALIATIVGERDDIVLVGHSMGGQVASLYAGVRTQRVARLVALDSLNVPDSDPQSAPERYRRWLDAHSDAPRPRVHASLTALAARIGARYPELDAGQREFLAGQWSAPAGASGARRLRGDAWHRVPLPYGFRVAEAMAIWRAVRAPVLCVDGAESPVGRYVAAADMAARRACFRSVRRALLPGCGHMLHLQCPQAVAAEIEPFIGTI